PPSPPDESTTRSRSSPVSSPGRAASVWLPLVSVAGPPQGSSESPSRAAEAAPVTRTDTAWPSTWRRSDRPAEGTAPAAAGPGDERVPPLSQRRRPAAGLEREPVTSRRGGARHPHRHGLAVDVEEVGPARRGHRPRRGRRGNTREPGLGDGDREGHRLMALV